MSELLFLALGGAGEIGMNLNLYGYGGKWLMVDLGITFGDDRAPGIDVVMPDPAFIVERRKDLLGLVLTHAHEDHLGAVADLWPRLRCPIFATPFAASVLRRKLAEAKLTDQAAITEIPLGGKFKLGEFDLEFVTMTHSIPEPNALVVRTPLGVIMHTGDWKIDPQPMLGNVTDEARLRQLGDEGVLAMVCDSTNVFVEGEAGSESDVRRTLSALVAEQSQRVAVTCFASNLARVESVALAAADNGRHPVLVGRALHRLVEAARENGYLREMPELLDASDAGWLPRDRVLYICTGSQGEMGAALSRLAGGEHPELDLERGDTAIFSSRLIPGNEHSVGRLQNMLIQRGIKVITDRDRPIHVSGHPARDELARLYQWVRPRIAIPVHGEVRHMSEHADLARALQVPEAIVAPNGSLVRLAPGPAEIIDRVPTGRLARDGNRLVPIDGAGLKARRQAMFNGTAQAVLVLNSNGSLAAAPRVSAQGFDDSEAAGKAVLAAERALGELIARHKGQDDGEIEQAARLLVRRAFRQAFDKKPLTSVQVVRLA